MEDILSHIPNVAGITDGALSLAQKVYDLQTQDPNIDKISFAKHSIPGYAGIPFLVAKVELKEPFTDVQDFKAYLQKHDLPTDTVFDEEDTYHFGFAANAYTSDAVYADFYQPSRLRRD